MDAIGVGPTKCLGYVWGTVTLPRHSSPVTRHLVASAHLLASIPNALEPNLL